MGQGDDQRENIGDQGAHRGGRSSNSSPGVATLVMAREGRRQRRHGPMLVPMGSGGKELLCCLKFSSST